MKIGKMTHVDPLKYSDGQDFEFLKIQDGGGRCPTEQGTVPVPCGCRLGCTRRVYILAQPDEYD